MTDAHVFAARREQGRVWAECSCGWADGEGFALESSAWEAWAEHEAARA